MIQSALSDPLLATLMADLRRAMLQEVRYVESVDKNTLTVPVLDYFDAVRRSRMQMVRSIERHYNITPKDSKRRRPPRKLL